MQLFFHDSSPENSYVIETVIREPLLHRRGPTDPLAEQMEHHLELVSLIERAREEVADFDAMAGFLAGLAEGFERGGAEVPRWLVRLTALVASARMAPEEVLERARLVSEGT